MTNHVLVMEFLDTQGKKRSIRVEDPKDDLEPAPVLACMNQIISINPFIQYELVSVNKAYVQVTTKEPLVFN